MANYTMQDVQSTKYLMRMIDVFMAGCKDETNEFTSTYTKGQYDILEILKEFVEHQNHNLKDYCRVWGNEE